MTYLSKVTKSGFNVLTETNINNYIFHSVYNTFKIIATGTISINVPANTNVNQTLAHGLSYVPLTYGFARKDSDTSVVCNEEDFFPFGTSTAIVFNWVASDATNLHFQISSGDSVGHTVYVRYYIFEVPVG